ncbi:hypothetical protein DFH09DRAFT_807408, partial [Mycena vulgaris]
LVDIIWGCLTTIFASTWVSVPPNFSTVGRSRLIRMLRRLGMMMLIAIIAPELIVFFAARQLAVTRRISRGMQRVFVLGHFQSLRGYHVVHGVSYINFRSTRRSCVLGSQYLADIRNVKREELEDKSKGDALSKGITLPQGLWFILQILARFVGDLPISELEVATLAFAVVNLFTWLLWWHKPLD